VEALYGRQSTARTATAPALSGTARATQTPLPRQLSQIILIGGTLVKSVLVQILHLALRVADHDHRSRHCHDRHVGRCPSDMASPGKPAPLSPSKLNNGNFRAAHSSPSKRGVSEQSSHDVLTARYEGACVGAVVTLLARRTEAHQPLPPPHEHALPFAGSDSPLKVRRISQRAASGVTQHRRWCTSSQRPQQNTPRNRRHWMRRGEHTHRIATPSLSDRPRERQPGATSPHGGARAATPTAACRACQTSKLRQVRSRRDAHGCGNLLNSLVPFSASYNGCPTKTPHASDARYAHASPCDVQTSESSQSRHCCALRPSAAPSPHRLPEQEKCHRKALPRRPARSCRSTPATLKPCVFTLLNPCCTHR